MFVQMSLSASLKCIIINLIIELQTRMTNTDNWKGKGPEFVCYSFEKLQFLVTFIFRDFIFNDANDEEKETVP